VCTTTFIKTTSLFLNDKREKMTLRALLVWYWASLVPEAQPVLVANTGPEHEPEGDAEPEAEADAETEVKAEAETETEAEVKAEAESEPEDLKSTELKKQEAEAAKKKAEAAKKKEEQREKVMEQLTAYISAAGKDEFSDDAETRAVVAEEYNTADKLKAFEENKDHWSAVYAKGTGEHSLMQLYATALLKKRRQDAMDKRKRKHDALPLFVGPRGPLVPGSVDNADAVPLFEKHYWDPDLVTTTIKHIFQHWLSEAQKKQRERKNRADEARIDKHMQETGVVKTADGAFDRTYRPTFAASKRAPRPRKSSTSNDKAPKPSSRKGRGKPKGKTYEELFAEAMKEEEGHGAKPKEPAEEEDVVFI
jgi:hypothetical protein